MQIGDRSASFASSNAVLVGPARNAASRAWISRASSLTGEAAGKIACDGDEVADHYDAVVIGSGAGGGTLARTLAMSGKRILLLERGNFLPRELCNWQPFQVLNVGRYVSQDAWYDAAGSPFEPRVHYFVGGATKLYGAALGRLRQADFGEIVHIRWHIPGLAARIRGVRALVCQSRMAISGTRFAWRGSVRGFLVGRVPVAAGSP